MLGPESACVARAVPWRPSDARGGTASLAIGPASLSSNASGCDGDAWGVQGLKDALGVT